MPRMWTPRPPVGVEFWSGRTIGLGASKSWQASGRGGPPMCWHPDLSVAWPETHRFAMWKFEDLMRTAVDEGLTSEDAVFAPPVSTMDMDDLVLRAHDSDYVRHFREDTVPPNLWRRIGFTQRPDHGALVARTETEVACTLLAAELARTVGMACALSGGTHHAHRSYGAGYCILNDLAVAGLAHDGPCLIVDVDVHQGDGTADIARTAAGRQNLRTFSLHCAHNYPFGFSPTAAPHLGRDRSDLDVALPAGAGDSQVLDALALHLPRLLGDDAADHPPPTLVLYDAGVDTDADDGLGNFQCTPQGIFQRDVYVLEQCVTRRIPVATVIGGGYDRDPRRLAHRHAIILRAATFVWRKFFHTFLDRGRAISSGSPVVV